jgi:hypothetical protein
MRRQGTVWKKRAKEAMGVLMVGDGLAGTVDPVGHCLLWQRGPRRWTRLVSFFAQRPGLTRAVAAAEAGAGLWLASRQWPR